MQRQKQQSIAPDVQAVAKALRKKEGGADEALRLIEHLPDKQALELLVTGAIFGQRRLILLIGFSGVLLLLSAFAWIAWLSGTLSRSLSFERQVTLILLLICSPLLVFLFSAFLPREEKNLELALLKYVPQVQQAAAVEPLLRYLARPFLSVQDTDTRRKCWEVIQPLLPRVSEEEARALSPESCDYLHRLVAHGDKRLPALSSNDKITVLLVLAARREERTRKLIEAQRAYPALREAAQSMLEEW